MKPSEKPMPVRSSVVLIPLLLSLSLMGCATTSLQPEQHCPRFPIKPALSEPTPSQSYLLSVEQDLKRWRDMLRATPLTP